MDTQTQIERLIELAIVQRTELKQLVEQLPALREHLNAEVERTFEEVEPQLRVELEEFVAKQAENRSAELGSKLEARVSEFAKTLQDSAQAKFSALMAARDQNADLLKQAEQRIADAAATIPANVKEIVAAELARFPRAGEIDQLRKEFAEPRGLNPRGKWTAGETYNRLDLVSYNGDSFVSSVDGNTEKPNRSGGNWTLSAARGGYGGGGGITSLIDLYNKPNAGQVLIGTGNDYTNANLTAGDGIAISNGVGSITISANGGVNYQGTWNASTNSPTLTSSVGTKGYYYVVSVAGSTNLNGVTDWQVGDWSVFNGSVWQKIDNTDQVSSVFGRTGAVVAVNTDYSSSGIDNTAIGATTPSTGSFTSLTTSGNAVIGTSVHASNGSAANPSLAFVNSQTTGFYRQGANIIGLSVAGTNVGNLSSTGLSLTGNATVGGTLTVSGGTLTGGTSGLSLANGGTNQNIALAITGTGTVSATSDTGLVALTVNALGGYGAEMQLGANLNTGASKWGVRSSNSSDGRGAGRLVFYNYTSGAEVDFTSSGNLLVGTTTDSSNGKLQLATHTTSAGGIGFGTDTALFRSAAGNLQLSASVASAAIAINNVGSGITALAYDATGALVYSTGSLRFQTNSGTTACTFDTSQNATFAGTVKVKNQATLSANGTVSVGTSATTILTLSGTAGANFCFICGDNGSNGFADLIVTIGGGNAITVISSSTLYGSPAARTYSSTGTSLQLALASGTLGVRATSIYTA